MTEDIKMGSNKSFGVVFSALFLLISLYPLINNENIRIWSLAICVIFLILGLLNSKFLTPLNKLWFKFGIFLGKIISPLVLGIIFFGVVTPTSLLMRLLRKDLLNLKFNKKKTYWNEKEGPRSKMKNQF